VKLESWHSADDKARFKVVDLRDGRDVPGEIVIADDESGECEMLVGDEVKSLSFGPGRIRIVRR
jgi:hypothetical protein